jgi:RHH-type transcriptional regulator, proline utilization regulon repressor / proline dehydrogenase / delta 1-pyrroline-5-carboxylate dehydrogenase
MIYPGPVSQPTPQTAPLRAAIDAHYRADETACVRALLDALELDPRAVQRVEATARDLVTAVRGQRHRPGGIDAFLQEYGLSTQEGVMLMCIAEALLRVPDNDTQERLIRDKIATADWDKHLGHSRSLFVNASTLALMLTGRVVGLGRYAGSSSAGSLVGRLVARLGEPVVREAVGQAMKILGRQFVMGRTIEAALDRAKALEAKGYSYSYDMLGEAARTAGDAARYLSAYETAIARIGKAAGRRGPVEGPGISVKLSALHPRYELAQQTRVMDELLPRLEALAIQAAGHDIGLNIDAEEADRLDLSLDLIEAVAQNPKLDGWDGFGVVVQAYQKRAPFVIDWLEDLAKRTKRRLMVRLVKGAYWDSEIKRAQELGLDGYPVFTRKPSTDVSYLACARKLLGKEQLFYPQFATHNAHTIAAVLEFAGNARSFEFQRLHGMGEALYQEIVESDRFGVGCRIYAPVGQHEDLLAYLVRRLLENGANSSFVNRLQDDRLPVDEIIEDPIARTRASGGRPQPRIPAPRHILMPERPAARGLDLTSPAVLAGLRERMLEADTGAAQGGPIVGGREATDGLRPARSPADRDRVVGATRDAMPDEIERALSLAAKAAEAWAARPVEERAACLERAADLMEERIAVLMALCTREAGKIMADGVAEVREAVDFCRYYAARARADMARPLTLRGPHAGQTVELKGGGVFVCISPWNFPLAIFMGQVTAALVAGNAVIAKPAEQTPLIAAAGTRILLEAGVPEDVLHLLPGDGATVGAALVADPRIAGVCFTGSTEVGRAINRELGRRTDRIPVLVAETGGLNAMIVDSTALPEQVSRDVLVSAFQSAGQRCSALRVLFLQTDVADRMLAMIEGTMDELTVGDPALLATDIGPVIDEEARSMLEAHEQRMRGEARLIKSVQPGPGTERGSFFGPTAFELDRLGRLEREVFGPILHVVRYEADQLDSVVEQINATGYGLTLGIHTRIDETWQRIAAKARVGNIYVNRNQIGALVGIQPFGGMGLSGTGPKAGGPHYLHRFMAMQGAAEPAPQEAAPQAPDQEPAEITVDFGVVAGAVHRALKGAVPDLETRARIIEQVATSIGGAAADHLRFFAAEARDALESAEPLPGPTGERNELRLERRGIFACIAADIDALTAQAAAAFVTGNRVLLVGPEARTVASRFKSAGLAEGVLGAVLPGGDSTLDDLARSPALDGIAIAAPATITTRIASALAAPDGPIRPLVPWTPTGSPTPAGGIGSPVPGTPHYLHRFMMEKTVSNDTTASGGNASLLAIGGEES